MLHTVHALGKDHKTTISSFVLLFLPLQVKSLVFDQSGTYLAVGGSDIRVYICKQWSEVLNFTGEKENLILHFVLLSVL